MMERVYQDDDIDVYMLYMMSATSVPMSMLQSMRILMLLRAMISLM